MQLFVETMNEKLAKEILCWKYNEPYDFYNNDLTDEAMKEMLDGTYYALTNDVNETFGFFCIGESAKVPIGEQFSVYTEDFVDMGIGMNPKYVGKGNGVKFCSLILQFIEERYSNIPIRLTVANFNERAIYLYEKLGFVKKQEFSTGVVKFTTMVKSNN
ncbi:GNAT family protein [Solibacillus sp. CAU 1738]|uniref:GNAT family protein n=1 Tax=Solibacillus sp. CAU 1738 TaxID=3140363 RepID=UPI0032609A21